MPAQKLLARCGGRLIGASIDNPESPSSSGPAPPATESTPASTVTKSPDRSIDSKATEADLSGLVRELTDVKFALDQSAIVATTEVNGRITYVNDKFCRISGYAREELLGRDHRIVNSGFHPKEFFRSLWDTIVGDQIWHGEVRNRAKDGSLYWVDTTIVPFVDGMGTPYQFMAIRFDITTRKRAESKLLEQQTFARLGEMAAVVAHEVKNPLAGISGALQVISSRLPSDGADRAIIGDILKRIGSLNDMVQDLLLFSRPQTPAISPTAIGALLSETAAAVRRDPALADVLVNINDADPTLRIDREQMRIVFQNLLLNAAQAMDGHGTIEIQIESGPQSCEVSVADEGPGLPAKVSEEMFEPFFTTKHRGSGLGLPIARRISEANGGQLTARNRPGRGAVLVVSLPAEPL